MVDFAEDVVRREVPYLPVQSLMDMDFYKLTMLYFIWKYYKDVPVAFELINRNTSIPVAKVIDERELRAALDHVCTLRFSRTDVTYLRGLDVYGKNMFPEEFLEYLRGFQMSSYELARKGDQYHLRFAGDWLHASMWEIFGMSVVSALYFRSLERRMTKAELTVLYARATARLWDEFLKVKANPNVTLVEGGTRRRHHFGWHRFALTMAREVLGQQLVGTSNVWMAFHYDMTPMGTNGHELQMITNALALDPEEKIAMQYKVLDEWQSLYGGGLRIALTDTFTSGQFVHGAPDWLFTDWRGFRQDSGDPFAFGDQLIIPECEARGVDPREKLIVFSDGLDAAKMDALERHFRGRIKTTFLQGTLFTNNFGGLHPTPDKAVPGLEHFTWDELYRPFSLVCKAVEANGRPCVKLSDNVEKATGPKEEVAKYLAVYGSKGRVDEKVIV